VPGLELYPSLGTGVFFNLYVYPVAANSSSSSSQCELCVSGE